MNVRFAPRGLAEAKRRKTWWLKNRRVAPDLYDLELRALLSVLPTTPMMGTTYDADVGFPVRRVLLKKAATHVYFGINGDELVVLSVWGARRRRGPKL